MNSQEIRFGFNKVTVEDQNLWSYSVAFSSKYTKSSANECGAVFNHGISTPYHQ